MILHTMSLENQIPISAFSVNKECNNTRGKALVKPKTLAAYENWL